MYLADDLPKPIERLLDRATAAAGSRDDAAFIIRYQLALTALLAKSQGHNRAVTTSELRSSET